MFLHVLKGIQAGSYLQLSDNIIYHIANDLDADIYLEAEDGQYIDFRVSVYDNVLTFSESGCQIYSDDEPVTIGQQYVVPLKCSIADGAITVLFSDSDIVEEDMHSDNANMMGADKVLPKWLDEDIDSSENPLSSSANETLDNEAILAEIRQKILNRGVFLKNWDRLRVYASRIKQMLGYWLYLIGFGCAILVFAVGVIFYSVYQQDAVANLEESKFSFKHKIEQLISTLPAKFNNFYVSNKNGEFTIDGIVNNSNDFKQASNYFKTYRQELKIKIVIFENIKNQLVKILADNNIAMGAVSFDVNSATVNLMGLAENMDDIDNAEIAIDSKYPGVGQMNANRVFLIKDVNTAVDNIFNTAALGQRLSVNKDFSHGIINVSGYLAPTELNNLTLAVNAFNQKYYPLVQIKMDVKNIFNALPFRIVEVYSGGDQSWIVTDDGTRLFEGGFYKGFSVVSISSESIVLKGKFTLTISTSQLALDSITNDFAATSESK